MLMLQGSFPCIQSRGHVPHYVLCYRGSLQFLWNYLFVHKAVCNFVSNIVMRNLYQFNIIIIKPSFSARFEYYAPEFVII